jgi:hypothetical protein
LSLLKIFAADTNWTGT